MQKSGATHPIVEAGEDACPCAGRALIAPTLWRRDVQLGHHLGRQGAACRDAVLAPG